MKRGGIRRVIFGAVLLAAAGGLWAAEHYKVLNGPKDFYFGHISYIEAAQEGTKGAEVDRLSREGDWHEKCYYR